MNRLKLFLLVVAVMVALGPAASVQAQTGGGYDLSWNTIAAGGVATSTNGGYSLAGAIGQSDAGMAQGGGYTLSGGFLYADSLRTYMPVILRNP